MFKFHISNTQSLSIIVDKLQDRDTCWVVAETCHVFRLDTCNRSMQPLDAAENSIYKLHRCHTYKHPWQCVSNKFNINIHMGHQHHSLSMVRHAGRGTVTRACIPAREKCHQVLKRLVSRVHVLRPPYFPDRYWSCRRSRMPLRIAQLALIQLTNLV